MSILYVAIGLTVIGVVAIVLGAEKLSDKTVNGIASGVGAGAGVAWKKTLGFDDVSIFYDVAFIGVGVGLAFLLAHFVRMAE